MNLAYYASSAEEFQICQIPCVTEKLSLEAGHFLVDRVVYRKSWATVFYTKFEQIEYPIIKLLPSRSERGYLVRILASRPGVPGSNPIAAPKSLVMD